MTLLAIRRLLLALFAMAGFLFDAMCTPALGQSFPTRPVKIIVGQGPGTTSDILARLIAPKLGERWSSSVAIENHSGAAGTIAATMVAKAAPDGHTLLLASSANLGMAAIAVEGLQYDPIRDFAPIARIARVPWALGVSARLPVKSVAELIAYSKAHPGRLTGASTGPGSAAWFGIEMLNRRTGSDILNVPYRAAATQVRALIGGEVDMVFTDLVLIAPHVSAGTIKILAAAGSKRLRAFPDIPTMGEQGVGGIVLEPWYGLAAPAGTPPGIVGKLSEALTEVLRTDEVRRQILAFGYEAIDETPADFAAAISADIARFSAANGSADPDAERRSVRPSASPPLSAPSQSH